MFRRPRFGETEDDLLEQQKEFLRETGKSAVFPNRRVLNEEEKGNEINVDLVRDIKEKDAFCSLSNFEIQVQERKGFPHTFSIDVPATNKKRTKSLFALVMEKKQKQKIECDAETSDLLSSKVSTAQQETASSIANYDNAVNPSEIKNLKDSIHEENLKKLYEMPESEILIEQKKLLNTLEPNLINFLKKRNENYLKTAGKTESKYDEGNVESGGKDVENKLKDYLDSKWINMDFIEKEKLEWIGEITDKMVLEPNQSYSARFDFKGELLPFKMEIDVRTSLYHHGDEPERPGYTIQELYQLSRSQVLQQRILALSTLANVIRKTKLGYYDNCFDGHLLHKLLDSDLFFLLRFSIDDNSMISASIFCLFYLICNECDEFCLDKLLGVTNVDKQPWLCANTKIKKEEEAELKDHVLISYDIIKGVLRTDVLTRLLYILNKCSPNEETTIRIINCLIRISRHSLEASLKILQTPKLLSLVYANLISNKPLYVAVKLFRVMSGQSGEIAKSIVEEYDIKFLVSFIERDEFPGLTRKEFFLLKLETLYLWRNFLIHQLYVDEFMSWSPCLRRLLLFYVEKVNVKESIEFDFELFAAISSLIIICNKRRIEQDKNVTVAIGVCLKKWLTQLIQNREYNFSVLKALGATLRYFITLFRAFGVTATDLDFIKTINSILMTLFQSEIFNEISLALVKFSHILDPSKISHRDPDSLPSLSSVYQNGSEFLKIVHHFSSLPFFMSLVKYLRTTSGILMETKCVLESFLKLGTIKDYLRRFSEIQITNHNWFMRFETNLLSEILKLLVIARDEGVLPLGFRLLPVLCVDDRKALEVLNIIFEGKNWNAAEPFAFPKQMASEYAKFLLQSDVRENHKVDLIPQEWPYKMLSFFKENNDGTCMIQALKFISFVLNHRDKFFDRISPTFRYYYTSYVFLVDSVLFDEEVQQQLEIIYKDIIVNREKVKLNVTLDDRKSFYDLYIELITQYAGVSYGLSIFARFILFPLQNNQDVAFRKLLWFEYLHVLRVVTLSFPLDNFLSLKDFIEPCETDESLLVAYVNSLSKEVITKLRNPFVYNIAVGNIKSFMMSESENHKLLRFVTNKINALKNFELKNDILNFSKLI